MTLNVSCPNCGKRFRKIKSSLIGKKAKCACGQVIRIGKKRKPEANLESKQSTRVTGETVNSVANADLMSVDLLGDELLGDQLLGGDLGAEEPAPVSIPFQRTESVPADLDIDLSPPRPIEPEPVVPTPVQHQKPAARKPTPTAQPKPNKRPKKKEVPVVAVASIEKPRRAKKKKRPKASSEQPIFAETYSDLDSILDGAGDAAPIVARPVREETVTPTTEGLANAESPPEQKSSILGLIAAICSAILAFWFGVFCFVARFSIIDQPLLRGFSFTLNSIYTANFGEYEISSSLETILVVLGWLFWLVTLILLVFGATQFLNALYKMVTGIQFFSWCDGLTGALGVLALFLAVGLIFTQASAHRQQQKFLDDYEKPVVAEGQHLETVEELRTELTSQQNESRNWMIFAAVVPMSVFAFSSIRLFTKS